MESSGSAENNQGDSPLSGITVLDLSIWGIGSFAAVGLSDLGADVIKIEAPSGDPGRGLQWTAGSIACDLPDGRNVFFEAFNRGKRGITLDLKQAQGRAILKELAREADVVVENFRPGVAKRLGIDYEQLRGQNTGLIYASATGYGPDGPDRDRPGLDYVGQARSGYMWTYGAEGEPPEFHTIGTADAMGAIMLSQGVLAALAKRATTGEGSLVETSHLGAMMWLQYWNINAVLGSGATKWPRFQRDGVFNPLWNHYQCADGRWIALGLLQADRHWKTFCQMIGTSELLDDARFKDFEARRQNNQALISALDRVFQSRTSDEWVTLLGSHPDFVFERVQEVTELADDPQVVANQYLFSPTGQAGAESQFVRAPFHFDGVPVASMRSAPALGEHTWQVLQERLGYSVETLTELELASAFG